jgi:hypothetical protein
VAVPRKSGRYSTEVYVGSDLKYTAPKKRIIVRNTTLQTSTSLES